MCGEKNNATRLIDLIKNIWYFYKLILGNNQPLGLLCIVANTVSDPVIEEHFRRSLGKNYKEAEPVSNSVSITGSVDDHFAKALGDAWLQIKAKGGGHQSSESDPWGPMTSRILIVCIWEWRFLTVISWQALASF